tara:strand:+ start:1698 stop:1832 length:135 start_codon:yes stop_codon:yes gene_type:complete
MENSNLTIENSMNSGKSVAVFGGSVSVILESNIAKDIKIYGLKN